jgi:hypothetical protein
MSEIAGLSESYSGEERRSQRSARDLYLDVDG